MNKIKYWFTRKEFHLMHPNSGCITIITKRFPFGHWLKSVWNTKYFATSYETIRAMRKGTWCSGYTNKIEK